MTNEQKIEAYLEHKGNTLTVVQAMIFGFGTELRSLVSRLNKDYEELGSRFRIVGEKQLGTRCKRYKMIKLKR